MHTISRRWTDTASDVLYLGYWFLTRGALLAATRVLGWQDRARSRRQLADLDDRLLRDIGLSRADVSRETTKPFWTD